MRIRAHVVDTANAPHVSRRRVALPSPDVRRHGLCQLLGESSKVPKRSIDKFHYFAYFHQMVKSRKIAKSMESAALDTVRALLQRVPNIQIAAVRHKEHLASDYRLDASIEFGHDGICYALLIELKLDGAPRHVRYAVYQLESCIAHLNRSRHKGLTRRFIPFLVSPYLSPMSRSICLDHNVAYLDLCGNARLEFGNVYIERSVPDRPKSEVRAQRSLFTPRAGAILRVLLRDPVRAWRVTDLALAANASIGHVSNVRRTLLDREWAEIRGDGLGLVQPDALLRSWRENYRRSNGHHVSGYTNLHGDQLHGRLSEFLSPGPQPPRAIFASSSAAQWFAPYVRDGTHSFYADELGARLLKETLQLTHAARGANVILRIPRDETLFEDAVQPTPGIYCANPVVTYLDLWNGNDRDREAADHLADKCFPWL
ncbi:MAG: hypothetical protein F4103_05600 [Boseongicola sp. SB0673_bin_14]|nr:hypothetical protein [Boseongicola sp. SB0673_bin_14]